LLCSWCFPGVVSFYVAGGKRVSVKIFENFIKEKEIFVACTYGFDNVNCTGTYLHVQVHGTTPVGRYHRVP
jgi:hypothetical protein